MIAVRGRVTPRLIMVPALLLSLAGPALAAPPGAARPRTEALVRSPVQGKPVPKKTVRLAKEQAFRWRAGVGSEPRAASVEQRRVRVVEPVRAIDGKRLTRKLDTYLAGRPGPVTAMAEDLATGRTYGYHQGRRMITASTAKVQILAALLMRTPWKKLPKQDRRDADLMIRYSDNHAADRLWARIGGAPAFTEAGRKLGMRHTRGTPGTCVDLYCWGITETTAEDQVRLMKALVSGRGPLAARDREQVLRLMGDVVAGQDWGISAAACDGERVHLKNGWLKRVSTERWVVVSAGLIRAEGRDFAIAVLSEDSAEVGHGIATVEGVAARIMKAFRACPS